MYEESIRRAEGFKLDDEPAKPYESSRLFKDQEPEEAEEHTFAQEIRECLQADEAKKAIIYAEILNRKY